MLFKVDLSQNMTNFCHHQTLVRLRNQIFIVNGKMAGVYNPLLRAQEFIQFPYLKEANLGFILVKLNEENNFLLLLECNLEFPYPFIKN